VTAMVGGLEFDRSEFELGFPEPESPRADHWTFR
jgi:hypothetical protein